MIPTSFMRIVTASALTPVCLLPITHAHVDAVTDWNVIALNPTAVPPIRSHSRARSRLFTARSARRLQRSTGRKAPVRSTSRPALISLEATVAAAADRSLAWDSPAELAMLGAALNASLSTNPNGQGWINRIAGTPKPGTGLYRLIPTGRKIGEIGEFRHSPDKTTLPGERS